MAAHAACADAALADDEHWDAISDGATDEGNGPSLDRTPRIGCLGVSSGTLLIAIAAATALLS